MKPDWSTAPTWARYWAIDLNNEAWFYEHRPVVFGQYDCWDTDQKVGCYELFRLRVSRGDAMKTKQGSEVMK